MTFPTVTEHDFGTRPACYFCTKLTATGPVYEKPPPGETSFGESGRLYPRSYGFCETCIHWTSSLLGHTTIDYETCYAVAAYGNEIMERFHKIVGLPPEKSDNFQRVQWIENKIHMYQTRHSTSRLLDVGAGLGVFPFEMARRGWNTTVLEPALEFCTHLRNIGFHEVLQGFYKPNDVSETFQLITLNKVLEHIADPAVVLDQLKTALAPDGLIYLEVPDGEAALRVGKDREEFFVEHLHVFSRNSLNRLLRDTSFIPIAEETLREPSGKFTLRSISKPQ